MHIVKLKISPTPIYVGLIQVFLSHTFSQLREYNLFVDWLPWEADSETELYMQESHAECPQEHPMEMRGMEVSG